jgi:hypothetical protein
MDYHFAAMPQKPFVCLSTLRFRGAEGFETPMRAGRSSRARSDRSMDIHGFPAEVATAIGSPHGR